MIALETADELHQRISQSTLATVERAGHLVMGDNPSGFDAAVRSFIDGFGVAIPDSPPDWGGRRDGLVAGS